MNDAFIRDCWYAVAFSDEVGEGLLARTALDHDIVLFRQADGLPVALTDRCPHRLLPLSRGKRCGDHVQCGYHGLTFNGRGACVKVPGQERIPPAAVVRAWPLAERYGLVFLWPGDPAAADPGLLPVIPKWDAPGWGKSVGPRTHFASNYLAILENLLDPAHTSFVHTRTIGNAAAAEVAPRTEERGAEIVAWRWIENADQVPLMQRFGNFAGRVDRWQEYHLTPPNFSMVDFGRPRNPRTDPENRDRKGRASTGQYRQRCRRRAHETRYRKAPRGTASRIRRTARAQASRRAICLRPPPRSQTPTGPPPPAAGTHPHCTPAPAWRKNPAVAARRCRSASRRH
jgi:phenylpropionate dioxygenase-like ring-hydroxylating dioxygenase large terminal subunit